MKILLRVEYPSAASTETGSGQPAGGVHDIEVELNHGHTIAELTAILAEACRTPHLTGGLLLHRATGRILRPEWTVREAGIVSGDTVALADTLGADVDLGDDPASTGWPGLHLVVTSGVDAGAGMALAPGTYSIGRARSAALTLTDPQVSRSDFDVVVGPVPAAGQPAMTVDPGDGRTNDLRVNGLAIDRATPIDLGDDIQVGSTTLRVRHPLATRRRPVSAAGSIPFERTPHFRRPVDVHNIDALGRVPAKPEPRRFQILAFVSPMIMGIAMATIFQSPRYLLFALLSPVVAIGNFIDSRRSGAKNFVKKTAELRYRIELRRSELAAHMAVEREQRHRNTPDVVDLVHQATTHHKRLWNRARTSADFLELRAGLGTVTSNITIKAETSGDEDLVAEVAEAMRDFDHLVDVPVPLNLAESGVIGVVGATTEVASFAGALAVQAACLHSPEDLVIAAAIPTTHGLNEWLKWLPHTRSKNSPIGETHIAAEIASAEELIRAVSRIAESRSAVDNNRLDPRWPWVMLIVDRALEPEPATVARLLDLGASVGVSVVWLADSDHLVPRQAQVVAHVHTPGEGVDSRLTFVDHGKTTQHFEPVRVGAAVASKAARALAPLVDASATHAAATVPSLVTLFEALGVDSIDPGWIGEQWLTDRGYTLPAPVGLTDSGPLTLDLVRHGPHGLIGGTSGAGKSELVQSLVANLIALNSPERVNILFIDYKGGALSGLFSDVPHSVGAVTNLDAMLSLRALTSLKAELDRRMALFEEKRVKDIKEMLENHPAEAPASLVLIVDEFASLVRELPEFVEGIVSIAERGRSLGIHLLLSTQRPSGSINENIQQNTNLRMSLRMLDAGESNNVIGTTDAATIPAHLKGRGYARLGPGELVAFQSSWSGAPLGGDDGPRPIGVAPFTTIPASDPLGVGLSQAVPIIPQMARASSDGTSDQPATELDAVIAAVIAAAKELGMERGRVPWRETLPSLIPLTEVLDDPRSTTDGRFPVTVGMIDDPEAQDQYPATIDLDDGGGLVVCGTGGSGKTTMLITAACSAAIRDSHAGGGTLTIFGLDFASRQLGVLRKLPQCETVANGDDLEAVTRVLAVLTRVFADRQNAASTAIAAGETPPEPTPILLAIDGYDGLADTFAAIGNVSAMQPWFDKITTLLTQGRQVGIFSVVGTSSMNGQSARLMNSMSNRITLRQADDNAYRSFGVPAAVSTGLELAPGQALTRTGDGMQIAVVGHRQGADGLPELDPGAVSQLAEGLVGSVLPECVTRALPTVVTADTVEESSGSIGSISVGLTDLTLVPKTIDLGVNSYCVIGPPRSGRSTALLSVARQLQTAGAEVWAVGPLGSRLAEHDGFAGSAFGRTAEALALFEEMAVAEAQFADATRFLLFDDADRFDDMALNNPLKALVDTGIRICGSTAATRNLMGTNPVHRELKSARSVFVLKAEDESAIQTAVGGRYNLRPGIDLPCGRGVLVSDGIGSVVHGWAVDAPKPVPSAQINNKPSKTTTNQGAI